MRTKVKVVTIGGGTGLSVLLRGLKKYPLDITAIVTVADDGGSSGKIRSDMNIPSPGDIRNVIAALSDVEPYLEKMFQYRFDSGEVKGHPVGNLMLAAMTDIHGDFTTAVKVMSKILNVRGKVLPTTNDIATLNAVLSTGEIIRGESSITEAGGIIDHVYITPSRVRPNEDVLKAIEEADYIIMGPGSLYTSIIPNLVISNVSERIRESEAKKIYVCNVMTQHGETDNYTVSDHIKAINKHVEENIFVIVSGLASGVDSLAHQAAIESKGYTIGVIAQGHNIVYPEQSRELYRQLEAKHLIISEYFPTSPIRKYKFLERNRLVAGLSKALLVTEAAERSGTQRTIDFALDLGNSVFCLPGRFGDKMSWSMNEYIKEGAILVNKLEDFGSELGF